MTKFIVSVVDHHDFEYTVGEYESFESAACSAQDFHFDTYVNLDPEELSCKDYDFFRIPPDWSTRDGLLFSAITGNDYIYKIQRRDD